MIENRSGIRVCVRTGRETAGPSTALRSGRDDNSVGPLTAIRLTAFGAISLQQNCHPDRSVPGFPVTRHSPTPACAVFSKESRMKFANATNLHRKSGVAQWRDLLFLSTRPVPMGFS